MGIRKKHNVLFIVLLLALSITCGCAKEDSLTDNERQKNIESQSDTKNVTPSKGTSETETENNSSVNKDNGNTGQTSSKQELRPGENGEYRVTVVESDWYTVTYNLMKEGFVKIKINDSNQLLSFGLTYMARDYKDMYGAKNMCDWSISTRCDGTLYEIVPGAAPCCIYKGETDVPYAMTEGLTQEEIDALAEKFLCGIWADDSSKYCLNMFIYIKDGITEEMALEILRNIQVSPM